MSVKRVALAVAIGISLSCAAAIGQEAEAVVAGNGAGEQIHAELRELRDRMFAAYESRDLDGLLADCAEEIVITWQNGERNVGHQEFRDFYDEMMSGDNAIVEDISTEFAVDDTSILYGGDTAVARGTVDDRFVLASGSEFLLKSKCTATVVRVDGTWKVASFHVSASIFDNPILDAAKGSLVTVGVIAAVCGVLLGLVVSWVLRRRVAS
ncbi:MAG: nuclear transport factor 2 family protein [Planctomycetales bacterium]|nr:nuclear transport factor 2 family protein [Planctomycetales bacterium]